MDDDAGMFAAYHAWALEEAEIVFPKVKVSSLPTQSVVAVPSLDRQPDEDPSTKNFDGGFDNKNNGGIYDAAAADDSTSDPKRWLSSHRGLFATDTIYPGERILSVPSTSLLGAGTLQRLGSELLADGQMMNYAADEQVSTVRSSKVDARLGEQLVLAAIEQLRRILLRESAEDVAESDASSHVLQKARDVGFEWRDDDAVAVYLACCRSLLQDDHEYAYGKAITESNRGDALEPQHPELPTIPDVDRLPLITEAVPVPEQVTSSDTDHDEVVVCDREPLASPAKNRACRTFLPLVAALPPSFPTSPLYYTDDELSRIDGTNCAEYARRMLQQFQSDYDKLVQVLRAFDALFTGRSHLRLSERVTFDAYKWALCNIYSRSSDFMIHSPTRGSSERDMARCRVIAPLFDMMNHDFNSSIQHSLDLEEHSSGDLSVFNGSDRAIEAGEEIRLSYGNFPNEKLLLIYGFVLEQNPYDAVAIYAPLNPSDPLYMPKCRLLQNRCGVEDPNEPHLLRKTFAAPDGVDENAPRQSVLPNSLISVLRLVGVQSADELMSIVKVDDEVDDGDSIASGIPLISIQNERSALLALQDALYSMSRQIALNLISDEGLRQGQDPSSFIEAKMRSQRSLSMVRNVNSSNSRILCHAEYELLQLALAEIHDRLSAVDGETTDQQ